LLAFPPHGRPAIGPELEQAGNSASSASTRIVRMVGAYFEACVEADFES
jgi:hypothetical protein